MSFRRKLLDIKESSARVLVVGLGVSGIEAALFLRRAGIKALACERQSRADYEAKSKYAMRLAALEGAGVELFFGVDGAQVSLLLEDVALAVLSPGVALSGPLCSTLLRKGIPVVGEMELGVEVQGLPSIVVTGSNGKSTTVALIHHFFQAAGRKSILCGNFGRPVVEGLELEDQGAGRPELLVVEASSYQLEVSSLICPMVGVLLNISDNHLERHGSIERYLECKARLFANQDESSFAVLNFDDARVRGLAPGLKASVCAIGTDARLMSGRPQALIDYERAAGRDLIRLRLPDSGPELYDISKCRLVGLHNRYDISAALLAARLWDLPQDGLVSALGSFIPLEHRLELVPGINRVLINDSKSTTVAASLAAWEAVCAAWPGQKITLMTGGLSKAGSWEPLHEVLKAARGRLNPLICFGGDAGKLAELASAAGIPVTLAQGVKDALEQALSQSGKEDVVLFSPGCASFDEFRDFEERGSFFKEAALALCQR